MSCTNIGNSYPIGYNPNPTINTGNPEDKNPHTIYCRRPHDHIMYQKSADKIQEAFKQALLKLFPGQTETALASAKIKPSIDNINGTPFEKLSKVYVKANGEKKEFKILFKEKYTKYETFTFREKKDKKLVGPSVSVTVLDDRKHKVIVDQSPSEKKYGSYLLFPASKIISEKVQEATDLLSKLDVKGSSKKFEEKFPLDISKAHVEQSDVLENKKTSLVPYGKNRIYIPYDMQEGSHANIELIFLVDEFELLKLERDKKIVEEARKFPTTITQVNREHALKRVQLFFELASYYEKLKKVIRKKYPKSFKFVRIGSAHTIYQMGMGPKRIACAADPLLPIELNAAHTACISHPTINLRLIAQLAEIKKMINNNEKGISDISKMLLDVCLISKEGIQEVKVKEYLFFLAQNVSEAMESKKSFFINKLKKEWENSSESNQKFILKDILGFNDNEAKQMSSSKAELVEKFVEGAPFFKKENDKNRENIFRILSTIYENKSIQNEHRILLRLTGFNEKSSEQFKKFPILNSEIKGSILDWIIDQIKDQEQYRKLLECGESYLVYLARTDNKLEEFLSSLPSVELLFNHLDILTNSEKDLDLSEEDANRLKFLLSLTDLLPKYINSKVDEVSDNAKKHACELLSRILTEDKYEYSTQTATNDFLSYLKDAFAEQIKKWKADCEAISKEKLANEEKYQQLSANKEAIEKFMLMSIARGHTIVLKDYFNIMPESLISDFESFCEDFRKVYDVCLPGSEFSLSSHSKQGTEIEDLIKKITEQLIKIKKSDTFPKDKVEQENKIKKEIQKIISQQKITLQQIIQIPSLVIKQCKKHFDSFDLTQETFNNIQDEYLESIKGIYSENSFSKVDDNGKYHYNLLECKKIIQEIQWIFNLSPQAYQVTVRTVVDSLLKSCQDKNSVRKWIGKATLTQRMIIVFAFPDTRKAIVNCNKELCKNKKQINEEDKKQINEEEVNKCCDTILQKVKEIQNNSSIKYKQYSHSKVILLYKDLFLPRFQLNLALLQIFKLSEDSSNTSPFSKFLIDNDSISVIEYAIKNVLKKDFKEFSEYFLKNHLERRTVLSLITKEETVCEIYEYLDSINNCEKTESDKSDLEESFMKQRESLISVLNNKKSKLEESLKDIEKQISELANKDCLNLLDSYLQNIEKVLLKLKIPKNLLQEGSYIDRGSWASKCKTIDEILESFKLEEGEKIQEPQELNFFTKLVQNFFTKPVEDDQGLAQNDQGLAQNDQKLIQNKQKNDTISLLYIPEWRSAFRKLNKTELKTELKPEINKKNFRLFFKWLQKTIPVFSNTEESTKLCTSEYIKGTKPEDLNLEVFINDLRSLKSAIQQLTEPEQAARLICLESINEFSKKIFDLNRVLQEDKSINPLKKIDFNEATPSLLKDVLPWGTFSEIIDILKKEQNIKDVIRLYREAKSYDDMQDSTKKEAVNREFINKLKTLSCILGETIDHDLLVKLIVNKLFDPIDVEKINNLLQEISKKINDKTLFNYIQSILDQKDGLSQFVKLKLLNQLQAFQKSLEDILKISDNFEEAKAKLTASLLEIKIAEDVIEEISSIIKPQDLGSFDAIVELSEKIIKLDEDRVLKPRMKTVIPHKRKGNNTRDNTTKTTHENKDTPLKSDKASSAASPIGKHSTKNPASNIRYGILDDKVLKLKPETKTIYERMDDNTRDNTTKTTHENKDTPLRSGTASSAASPIGKHSTRSPASNIRYDRLIEICAQAAKDSSSKGQIALHILERNIQAATEQMHETKEVPKRLRLGNVQWYNCHRCKKIDKVVFPILNFIKSGIQGLTKDDQLEFQKLDINNSYFEALSKLMELGIKIPHLNGEVIELCYQNLISHPKDSPTELDNKLQEGFNNYIQEKERAQSASLNELTPEEKRKEYLQGFLQKEKTLIWSIYLQYAQDSEICKQLYDQLTQYVCYVTNDISR